MNLTPKTGTPQFPLRLNFVLLANTKCTLLWPSAFFTNDLFFSKRAAQAAANRWGLRSNAQSTAGRAGRKERTLSFRAAVAEPAEGWHPPSTTWGRKHCLTPQGIVSKKLLSLESQQGNDGRRLGPSNERVLPRALLSDNAQTSNVEMCNLVGVKGVKKKSPQRHLKKMTLR